MHFMVPPSSPALVPFVRAFGYLEGPREHGRELALPSGAMQLLVNFDADEIRTYHRGHVHRRSGAVLQGPHDRASIIDTAAQRAVAWVGFRAAGAYPFFAVPPGETRGALVDLEVLWGRDGATLRERLLEAPTPGARLRMLEKVLLTRVVDSLRPDPAIRYAVAALEHGAAVGEVVDRVGGSAKRFGRRFARHAGLTPKKFARVRRFQRLLDTIVKAGDRPEWAQLAADGGYHDQAHMIHEFGEFTGLSPTGYRPRSLAEPNHVPL